MLGYMIVVFMVVLFLVCMLELCSTSGNEIRPEENTVQMPHVYYMTADMPVTRLPVEGLKYCMRERGKPQYMSELDMMVYGVVVYDRELTMQDVHRLGLVRKPREDA